MPVKFVLSPNDIILLLTKQNAIEAYLTTEIISNFKNYETRKFWVKFNKILE